MKIVPNDYCNECKKGTDLIVTGMDEHSVLRNVLSAVRNLI